MVMHLDRYLLYLAVDGRRHTAVLQRLVIVYLGGFVLELGIFQIVCILLIFLLRDIAALIEYLVARHIALLLLI